jgi:Family of unknown function (DUF5309)
MATYTSYDAVGLKEDVSNIITNITPTKTPFQSAIGREKITQRWFQWQEDSLRATQVNAQVEGFNAAYIQAVPTAMRHNTTQIFAEAVQVSGSMEATSTYGRARESAYQLAKSAAQVKRDLEAALVGTYTAETAGGDAQAVTTTPQNAYQGVATTATARMFASYPALVNATGAALGGAIALPAGANVVVTGASTTGTAAGSMLTEPLLVQALQNCYTNGAEPSQIMVTPPDSVAIAAFASAAGRYRTIPNENNGANKKIVNAVNLYVSPFGEQRVILNRFLHNTLGQGAGVKTGTAWTLVYDPSMWALATLRSWFREVLAKTGDAVQQMIVGEFSLKHKNFGASSAIVQNVAAAANASTGW